MGSKRPGSREHCFKKAREQGAKEINLGSREHGQKAREQAQKVREQGAWQQKG